MKSICVITARGGSKRIPHKNIKDFCGKPIIAYSIQAALDSGLFDEVMVSTDDRQIADIAESYGAKVPFLRSEATSNDYATTFDVLMEVVNAYKDRGMEFDVMCCIYPTAPFVTGEKLKAAMERLESSQADLVMPMVQFSFPPQRGYVVRDGAAVAMYPEMIPMRSQDLEPVYHDVGQFYFYRMATFGDPARKRVEMIVVSDTEAQDIDNYEDWEIAEMKYNLMIKK